MGVSFGRSRSVIPPSNLGVEGVAQRRVSEAAGRAAERTRVAVRPDAHMCRVWMRNPRGTIPCLCSVRIPDSPVGPMPGMSGPESARVTLPSLEGDDVHAMDSGYPLPRLPPDEGDDLPADNIPPENQPSWLEDLTRLLLGNGRRCGVCLGTGWVDGFKLWGGARAVCCASPSTTYTALVADTAPMVDADSPTPTFVGPGSLTWSVDIPYYCTQLDAVRVREGLVPANGSYTLLARNTTNPTWQDVNTLFGCNNGVPFGGVVINSSVLAGLQLRLTLGRGVRASHVELVFRSEPLVCLQLPQLQQAAAQELIAPFVAEECELDPVVGAVERGTLLEVPGVTGRIGMVWVLTDCTIKQTAQGQVFGVTGNVRNAQPTDTVIAALLDDSNIGIIDPGVTTRGLEATEGGQPSGLYNQSDDSLAAAKRGSSKREGGGTASTKPVTIILSSGNSRDEDLP